MVTTASKQLERENAIESRAKLLDRFSRWFKINVAPLLAEVDSGNSAIITDYYEMFSSRIAELEDSSAVFLSDLIDRITSSDESWAYFKERMQELAEGVGYFFANNPEKDLLEPVFSGGAARFADVWMKAANQGWYISTVATFSGLSAAIKGGQELDEFMIQHLDKFFEEFSEKSEKLFPERATILKEAFLLHNEGRYIASVPLLLMQADGICAQSLGVYLFSEHDKRYERVSSITAVPSSGWASIFFNALIWKTQIGASISNSSQSDKARGPNRNGIVHGSRKHLDYGTRINSYKALSFFFFIAFLMDKDTGPLKRILQPGP